MIVCVKSIELVAKRTYELRTRFNLSQQELAELTGLSEVSIQRLEANLKKQVWLQTVEQIAEGFSLKVHEFMAPRCPSKARLARKVPSSSVHRNKRLPRKKG